MNHSNTINNKLCRERERDLPHLQNVSINLVASIEISQLSCVCNAVILFTSAASQVLYFATGPAIFPKF